MENTIEPLCFSATEAAVRKYLVRGGALPAEIEDFLDWCTVMCLQPGGNGLEKRRRFKCYKLWARLLRHRRTPFAPDTVFNWEEFLKNFLRETTGGDPTDGPPPLRAIHITNKDFVMYVVRHIDDAY